MSGLRHHQGVTRVEVMVLLIALITALSISAILAAQPEGRSTSTSKKSIKDAVQVDQIHKAMIIWAREYEGNMPRPGLVNRLADGDLQLPGRGPEDTSANITANLYSLLLSHNYITPEILISPVERNPNVKVMKDYKYEQYNPANDIYWDSDFTADLKQASNVSYAHPPLVEPHVKLWNDDMRPDYAQLGNRGPRDGKLNPDSHTCGPHGHWAGNVAFGDNHTELLTTTTPSDLDGDNLFAADKDRETDCLLAFTGEVEDGKATVQFD